MSDCQVLVDDDECQFEHDKTNGVLINVAPFNGTENIGYDYQSPRHIPAEERAENKEIEEDFIMAIFVVVFDTRHGE